MTAFAAVEYNGTDTHDGGSSKTFLLYTSIESLFYKVDESKMYDACLRATVLPTPL